MFWGFSEVDGWYYTEKWNYYQRCEGNVVAYIEKMFGFYRVHVTTRGQLGMCDIEFRNESFNIAHDMAMQLLEKYKDKNKDDLWGDYYSPHNPNGYWQIIYYKKDL